jgi:hypothetical protein
MFPTTLTVRTVSYRLESVFKNLAIYQCPPNLHVVVKKVQHENSELYFHLHVHDICFDQSVFVQPLHIQYNYDDVYIIYPYSGQTTCVLAQSNFWATYEHLTISIMYQLMEKMQFFHAVFMMAMGNITPISIVYNDLTGVVRYRDLEHTTAQTSMLAIPDRRTSHYKTVATPCFSSFEKRSGGDYCVFRNDEYALATTMYCLLTNRHPPGLSFPEVLVVSDRVQWDLIHTNSYRDLVFYLHHTLKWSKSSTVDILDFISTHWVRRDTTIRTDHPSPENSCIFPRIFESNQ